MSDSVGHEERGHVWKGWKRLYCAQQTFRRLRDWEVISSDDSLLLATSRGNVKIKETVQENVENSQQLLFVPTCPSDL